MRRRMAAGEELSVELWDRDSRRQLAKGRVVALDNAIDSATGTIKVKAAFANEDGALYPNQFVNVRLQVNLLQGVLTVPATAVQNNYVYLVQEDSTVTQRRIRVGVTDGDRVSVEGELREGEQVVTDGIDRLREGAKVAVIDAGAVTRADQAAQDQAAQRRAFIASLPPDVREKLQKMSPKSAAPSCAIGERRWARAAQRLLRRRRLLQPLRRRVWVLPPLPRRPPRRPLQRHNSSAAKHHPEQLHRPPPPQRLQTVALNPHGASLRR